MGPGPFIFLGGGVAAISCSWRDGGHRTGGRPGRRPMRLAGRRYGKRNSRRVELSRPGSSRNTEGSPITSLHPEGPPPRPRGRFTTIPDGRASSRHQR